MIQLEVVGTLEHRDVVLRTISAACRLAYNHDPLSKNSRDFRDHVVSAVGEAFNNVALHGYPDGPGAVQFRIEIVADALVIEMKDFGVSYDPASIREPDFGSLPESGMGIYIMRSFLDSMDYTPGPPNVLRMVKRIILRQTASATGAGGATET